jgi:hypothetical protein
MSMFLLNLIRGKHLVESYNEELIRKSITVEGKFEKIKAMEKGYYYYGVHGAGKKMGI